MKHSTGNRTKAEEVVLITQEFLIDKFDYNPETGEFKRRIKVGSRGRMTGGQVVGTIDKDGYRCTTLFKKGYKVHRLIWMYVYGVMPDLFIDHINMDSGDNRISNLRLATMSQNLCNRGPRKRNKSGYKGVSFNKNLKKWDARISFQNKQYCLGLFKSKEDAYSAYCEKAKSLHGEFARVA